MAVMPSNQCFRLVHVKFVYEQNCNYGKFVPKKSCLKGPGGL